MSPHYKSGGYRKLHFFSFATLIQLTTIQFCKRFIPQKEDPHGKASWQLISAARSGRQNIIEGSKGSGISKETEMRLTEVARASLADLLSDFEIFLAERGAIPWSNHSSEHQAVSNLHFPDFANTDDSLHDYWQWFHREKHIFAPWLENDDPIVVAQTLLVLIRRTMAMLSAQMRRQGEAILDARDNPAATSNVSANATYAPAPATRPAAAAAPDCPACGRPMRQRTARKGPRAGQSFWSCTAYPECKGTRAIEAS